MLLLTAGGLITGEIAAQFSDVYGATDGKDTISRITDAVVEKWANGATVRWSASTFAAMAGSWEAVRVMAGSTRSACCCAAAR